MRCFPKCPINLTFLSLIIALSACNRTSLAGPELMEVLWRTPINDPGRLAVADVNNDGRLDLLVPSQADGTLHLFWGDGAGRFSAAPGSPYNAGANPRDVVTADFNGDGRVDVAIPNHETNRVQILLGTQAGTFTPAPGSPLALNSNPHVHYVAAGDVNRDGKIDLVGESWQDNQLIVLAGNGDGTFAIQGTVSVPAQPRTNLRFADLNRDGIRDMVTPAMDRSGVTVLLGSSRNEFVVAKDSPIRAGKFPFHLATGDLNGDGFIDVAAAHRSGNAGETRHNRITVLLGDGKGGLRIGLGSPYLSEAPHAPSGIEIADFDGDGFGDIATANWQGTVTILLGGKQKMTLPKGAPFKTGKSAWGIAVGDVDRDGRSEIVVTHPSDNDVAVLKLGSKR